MAYFPNNSNGQATMANSAPVVISSDQSAVPVSGTVTANIGTVATLATAAKQDTGNTSVGSIDTKTPALGQALAAASIPIVLTAAQITTLTPPAAITGFNLEATQTAMSAKLPATLAQKTMANSLAVVLASDQSSIPVAATLAAETTKVIGTVNQGTSPWVTSNATTSVVSNGAAATAQRVTIANDSTGILAQVTLVPTVTTVSTVTSLTQMNGTAIAMNTGARAAGVQRVTIATDDLVPVTGTITAVTSLTNALPTGTNTIGNVGIIPRTTGGLTTYHLVSAATTNLVNIKASAGQLFGWYIYNSNAAARKVAFHNSASAPTAGASIFFTLVIPPTSGANVFLPMGIAFSAGISISTVTGLADNDSAAVALNDLNINLFYS